MCRCLSRVRTLCVHVASAVLMAGSVTLIAVAVNGSSVFAYGEISTAARCTGQVCKKGDTTCDGLNCMGAGTCECSAGSCTCL
jgi:hypothetical protein